MGPKSGESHLPRSTMKRLPNVARKAAFAILAAATASTGLTLGFATPAQAAAVLKLTKTAVSPTVGNSFAGAQMTWSLGYSCISVTDNCVNVKIADTLPGGTTLVSADNGGVATAAGVDWNLGTLTSGAAGTLTVTAIAPCSLSAASFNNSATATGTGLAPVTKTAAVNVTAASTCAPPPPLPFAKTGPTILNPGGRIHYNFTLSAHTTAYIAEDVLPTGAEWIKAEVSAPITSTVTCDGTTWVPVNGTCITPKKIRFNVPAVTNLGWAGYGAPYTGYPIVRMRVPVGTGTGGTITNNAATYQNVGGVPGAPTGDTGAASGNVAAAAPMTAISKWNYKIPGAKDGYNTAPAGQTTSTAEDAAYQIVYGNNGGSNAAGASLKDPVITDLLDADTEWVAGQNWWTVSSAGPGCSTPTFTAIPNYSASRTLLRWSFPGCTLRHDLDYNDTITVNATARMKPGLVVSTLIHNDAYGQEGSGQTPQLCDQGLVVDALDVDGDGSTTDLLCTAPAEFALPKLATFDSSKWVNGAADPASTWSRYPAVGKTAVAADGYATYRLFLKPTGNIDTSKIELVDVLPFIGDTAVSEASLTRLSDWSEKLAGPLQVEILPYESITAPITSVNTLTGWTPMVAGTDYTADFSHSTNPCRINPGTESVKVDSSATAPAGCVNDWSANSVDANAFRLNVTKTLRRYNPTATSGDIMRITVRVKDNGVAASDINKVAWNSFAYTVTDNDATPQEFLTAEPIKVGVRMTADPVLQPSLGDYVWYDEDHNGQQDSFEEGIDGVVVSLYNAAGKVVRTTVTAVDPANPAKHGYYRFDGLDDSATYSVKIDRASDLAAGGPLAGFVLTGTNTGADATDNDAALDGVVPTITGATTGTGSSHTPTYDFGFWKAPNYSIGNRVWFDDDNSGDMNGTDAGVDNVKMNLFKKNTDGSFTSVGTDTTQGGGYYRFDGLAAGDYYVQVDPTNFAVGGPLEGRRSSTGSLQNANPNSDIDKDDNGIDPATTADYTATGDTKGVISNVVTLGPGKSEPAAETELSATGQGAEDLRGNMTVDFGFITPKFAVGNYVWEDVNNNGLQASDEPGINDVTVTLYKADCATPAGSTQTKNGPDGKPGFYLFDNLLAGTYCVKFDKPIGYEFTKQTIGSNAAIDSNADPVAGATQGKTATFVLDETLPSVDAATDGAGLKAARVLRDIDAGISKRYSVGNVVWHDVNGDSLLNGTGAGTGAGTEAGIDGVSVQLFASDAAGLPTGVPLATQTTTNGGHYLFTNLFAGMYVVVIPNSQFNAGAPLAGFFSSATTTSGETAAALADADINNDDNGTKAASGDVVSSKITLGGTDEPIGEPATPGHADTTPDTQSNTTVDFGFVTMSLGNLVWEDTDNNGTRNGSEPVIANVVVHLYLDSNADGQPDGNEIATTSTNADGQYLFTGLAPGKYIVEIEPPAGFYSSSGSSGSYSGPFEPGKGDDTALDTQDHGTTTGNRIRSTTIMLTPATEPLAAVETDGLVSALSNKATDANTDLTVDFGLVPGASIGNYVWLDNNRDGIQNEPKENGINGVTVKLVDKNGVVVKTTVTSAGPDGAPGYYRFDVIPGDYKVMFDLTTLPEGFVVSPANKGTNDEADSDADPANGMTSITTLDPNENDPSWDLGVYPTAVVVGNFVWFDGNSDGIQNDGPDSGFEGVTVVLCDANGKEVTVDVQGNPMKSTQVTDASGHYLFSNLKPGTYTVKFTAPAGYVATTTGNGDPAADSNGLMATSRKLKGGESDLTLDLGLVKAATALVPVPTVPTTSTTEPATTTPAPTVAGAPVAPVAPSTTKPVAPGTTVPRTTNHVCGDVFADNNKSLDKEGSEVGIANVKVRILDAAGNVVAATITDASGHYCFDVAPGEYVIEIEKPNGLNATTVIRRKLSVLGNQVNQAAPNFGLADPKVNGDLALTGTSSSPIAAFAACLITAGIVALMATRRKKQNL
jgi:hypothetical protein